MIWTVLALPNGRSVQISGNSVQVLGDDNTIAEGMMLASDSGAERYAGTIKVANNDVKVENGHAAFVLGSTGPPSVLSQAELVGNVVTGNAEYAMASTDDAEHCEFTDNDMTGFVATVAETGQYGEQITEQ